MEVCKELLTKGTLLCPGARQQAVATGRAEPLDLDVDGDLQSMQEPAASGKRVPVKQYVMYVLSHV